MLQLEDDSWTVCPNAIRSAFINHFKQIYCEPDLVPNQWPVEVMESLQRTIPSIDPTRMINLASTPTKQEIAAAIFELGPDRAPGPDGINARLLQTFWPTFSQSVENEITKFFQTATLPLEISKANMILIPKKDNPARVTDYRPISVCNVIYKVISKILANRLKPLVRELVHTKWLSCQEEISQTRLS